MSQPNKERRLWLPEENEIIRKAVAESPNASQGFNLAVSQLHERTYSAISGHYYDLIAKQNGGKKKTSPVKKLQPPLEIGRTLINQSPGTGLSRVTVYRPTAKKDNFLPPAYDDTELYETICMLIPRLNPGRKLDLVKFLFADH